jgi:hypothetical protein
VRILVWSQETTATANWASRKLEFSLEKTVICDLNKNLTPLLSHRNGWLVIDSSACGPLPFGSSQWENRSANRYRI